MKKPIIISIIEEERDRLKELLKRKDFQDNKRAMYNLQLCIFLLNKYKEFQDGYTGVSPHSDKV